MSVLGYLAKSGVGPVDQSERLRSALGEFWSPEVRREEGEIAGRGARDLELAGLKPLAD